MVAQEIEETCLRYLTDLAPCRSEKWTVTTPRLFHYEPETHNQILEFQPAAMSLKDYALKHYAAPTPPSSQQQCTELGEDLGGWLTGFHEWANHKDQAGMRDLVSQNKQLQFIKHMINYAGLVALTDRFPATLGESKALFEEIRDTTAKETADESSLSVIHGDFWTGKYAISPLPCKMSACLLGRY